MPKPTVGRGNKAPYETTHVRVPMPIKKDVERLIEQYRNDPENLLTDSDENKQIVLRAIDRFIEQRRNEWGKNGAQRGEFNPENTRYHMLNEFRKRVESGLI